MAERGQADLREVLRACVGAAAAGCAEVRRWQTGRAAAGGRLEAGAGGEARLKDPEDDRSAVTAADLAAERAIVSYLAERCPGLRVVGEEGQAPAAPGEVPAGAPPPALGALADAAPLLAPLAELTAYVDPVDGTRELVEGRLGNVQTLVGVAWRGRAVAGAVGVPLAGSATDAPPATFPVVYGLIGRGAGVVEVAAMAGGGGALAFAEAPGPGASVTPRVSGHAGGACCAATGDSKNPRLAAAKAVLEGRVPGGTRWVQMGGAGNKLLAVAEGRVDAAVMHFGTSLWDTCAPEAVVRALGGSVSDLFGSPLVHGESPLGTSNAFGVFATSAGFQGRCGVQHGEVCAEMRACGELLGLLEPWAGAGTGAGAGGPQAVDVARDLRGAPLSRAWLSRGLLPAAPAGGGGGPRLAGYSAPESGGVRGLMSEACRLILAWEGGGGEVGGRGEGEGGGAPAPPSSAYYKRIVMGDLEHVRLKARTAPMKIARDVRSYEVEVGFLGSAACRELGAAGVPVPRAFAACLEPCPDDLIESRFSVLLEDFSPEDGWTQGLFVTPEQAPTALAALARMHAFFWEGSAFWRRGGAPAAELEAAVWPSGAYWQPDMQPPEQMDEVAAKWERHRVAFAPAHEGLGARLQAVAREVGAEAHPFGSTGGGAAGMRTLIHGDPKAANLFFRERPGGCGGELEVGLIDFQWSGFGLAATDIAYFLGAGCDAGCLSDDGSAEGALLDEYWARLLEALVEFGAAGSPSEARALFPRETLQLQYEAALLDLSRTVIAYHWDRIQNSRPGLSLAEVFEANGTSMARNSYNKSLPVARWVVARTAALLERRAARA